MPPSARPDVVLLGHITRDRIFVPGQPERTLPGGSAYYAGLALARLGVSVKVVTKLAPEDEAELLGAFSAEGIPVENLGSPRTTVFENRYEGPDLAVRHQRVASVAEPFLPEELAHLNAPTMHLGPLTQGELPFVTLQAARRCAKRLSLDAQGLLRRLSGDEVVATPWPDAQRALGLIDVLKVDDTEAAVLVGEASPVRAAERLARLGVAEVLITFADRGSLVLANGLVDRIFAIPPHVCADATGCGDTYVAGYLAERLRGQTPALAARFAAAAASLKLGEHGPLLADHEGVSRHLENWSDRKVS